MIYNNYFLFEDSGISLIDSFSRGGVSFESGAPCFILEMLKIVYTSAMSST